MSYSDDVTVIISIAQQARPIVSGHTDELCAQRATSSSRASKKWPGLLPHVGVADAQDDDKHHHFGQAEDAQCVHLHGPWIERRRLDVEDDEQHRDQVETHREAAGDRRGRLDPAFVGFRLVVVRLAARDQSG
jgi:hypothetical protein